MSADDRNGRENGRSKPDIGEIFATPGLLDAAMQKASRQAIRRHKLLGESIAVSQDGKVVILAPDEIPDFPEDESLAR